MKNIELLKELIMDRLTPKFTQEELDELKEYGLNPDDHKIKLDFYTGEQVNNVNSFYGMETGDSEVMIFEDYEGLRYSDSLIRMIDKAGGLEGYEMDCLTDYKVTVYKA